MGLKIIHQHFLFPLQYWNSCEIFSLLNIDTCTIVNNIVIELTNIRETKFSSFFFLYHRDVYTNLGHLAVTLETNLSYYLLAWAHEHPSPINIFWKWVQMAFIHTEILHSWHTILETKMVIILFFFIKFYPEIQNFLILNSFN